MFASLVKFTSYTRKLTFSTNQWAVSHQLLFPKVAAAQYKIFCFGCAQSYFSSIPAQFFVRVYLSLFKAEFYFYLVKQEKRNVTYSALPEKYQMLIELSNYIKKNQAVALSPGNIASASNKRMLLKV